MKAIDLQVSLSRAPLAGREQQIQHNSSELGQRYIVQAQDQQRVLDHSRTQPSDKTEPADHRLDDHEDKNKTERKKSTKNRRRVASEERALTQKPISNTSQFIDLVA